MKFIKKSFCSKGGNLTSNFLKIKNINFKMVIKNYSNTAFKLNETDSLESTARIRVKNVFLTYSQVDEKVTREYILKELSKKAKFSKYVIAKELHKDKGIHFHVVLNFNKQLNHSMNFFDIKNPNKKGKAYHPNIKYAKPLWQKVLYCIKEDQNYLINGFSIEQFKKLEESNSKNDLMAQVILKYREEGYNKALDYFLENSTDKQRLRFTTKIMNILKTLNHIASRIPLPNAKFTLEDFYRVVGVENFFKVFDKKFGFGTIFLGGITGIGKSNYFEALLTALGKKWVIVTDFEELKNYDLKLIDFIIFDDVDFKNYKTHEDFLKLFDHLKPTPIPCRHYDVVIPAGVGRIFLSNLSFYQVLEKVGLSNDEAIIRRVYECVIIHYLSPKIKINKRTKAIVYNISHITNYNIINSTIDGNLIINPREHLIPEYKSIENKILNIESFVDEAQTQEQQELLQP